ncbi:MAG TPA: hypothetical protein PKD85_20555 [Saprospiraceae bacterium]|nr:hypothetical protein [Saprospiraceae bacterium]
MEHHFDRFDQQGVTISKAIYDPIITVTKKDGQLFLTLRSVVADTEIKYSMDNTYPLTYAQTYRGQMVIPEGELALRTQLYRNGKPLGRMLQISRAELEKRAK